MRAAGRGRGPAGGSGGTRLTRRGRVVAWSAGVSALVLLGAGGAGAWIWYDLNDNITSAEVDDKLGGDRPQNLSPGSKNILVVGSDSRDGRQRQVRQGPDHHAVGHADGAAHRRRP